MELVVVNGGNTISRGVISRLLGKSYPKLRMVDPRPYRKSAYCFQQNMPGVQMEKVQVQSFANLDLALEGAKDVVYFTHDYFANTPDKNNFIQATAKLSKKHGVERLVAVCPVEHELFYTEDN